MPVGAAITLRIVGRNEGVPMSKGRACRAVVVLAFAFCAPLEPAIADPAQSGRIAKIGYLAPVSREQQKPYAAAFVQGLRDFGYVEGQNVSIEWRFADGQADRLPTLAAELVQQ